MALGSLISIKKSLTRTLSWVADLGWLVAIVAMYLLSLYLVIHEKLAHQTSIYIGSEWHFYW